MKNGIEPLDLVQVMNTKENAERYQFRHDEPPDKAGHHVLATAMYSTLVRPHLGR
jgi:hypothetical protein